MPDPLVPLRRDLTTFTDVTAASGIHREYGMGACAGDVDDGRTDLFIANYLDAPPARTRSAAICECTSGLAR